MTTTRDIIVSASQYLRGLEGCALDLLTISKPDSPEAAINLAKIVSKLSPILGNLIEFDTVDLLNNQEGYSGLGSWKRQDPGFPDAIFEGSISPIPGFEIKAWLPLATEITARFKDSQNHFLEDQTYVCLLAWLPDQLIFGKPKVIDVCVVSGQTVAAARDEHYHNPPDYLVLEPQDTTDRTSNLQQTNTNGYRWQGSDKESTEANKLVESWGKDFLQYKPTPEYQDKLRELFSKYKYRLDTNFAKIDRIGHDKINEFKNNVLNSEQHGKTINEWKRLLSRGKESLLREALEKNLEITEDDLGNNAR